MSNSLTDFFFIIISLNILQTKVGDTLVGPTDKLHIDTTYSKEDYLNNFQVD